MSLSIRMLVLRHMFLRCYNGSHKRSSREKEELSASVNQEARSERGVVVVVVGGGLSLCICCKNQRSHCKSNLPPRIIVGTLMEPSIGPMLSGFVCCPNFLVRVYLEYYGMKRLGDFLMLRLPWFGNFLNICIILPFEFGISKAGTCMIRDKNMCV